MLVLPTCVLAGQPATVAPSTERSLSSGWEGEDETARNRGTISTTQGSWQCLVGNC